MSSNGYFNTTRIRLISFIAVAILHILLLLLVVFRVEIAALIEEPVAGVMKLVDVKEELPPPPPEKTPELPQTNTMENIAQTMIETDEPPPPPSAPVQQYTEQVEYLPQHKISVLPVLPDDEIRRAMVYPPIAQRSGIEGRVFLELFIDRQGNVRDVRILREDPPNRGFGEAAINAFKGIRGKPAEANGEPVAVRYRYVISFKLN